MGVRGRRLLGGCCRLCRRPGGVLVIFLFHEVVDLRN